MKAEKQHFSISILLFFLFSSWGLKANANVTEDENNTTLVYFGGDIITMQGEQPEYVETVVQKNGKIAFAGDLEKAQKQFPDATQKDLHGKTLLPGFIDPHGHFSNALQLSSWANVSPPPVGLVKSIDDIIYVLKAHQEKLSIPKGEWIIAYGYDQNQLPNGKNITVKDLDPVFPDNPVFILHISNHGAVLNTQGFKRNQMDENTLTPEGGNIERLANNKPAGLIMETAFFPVLLNLPHPSEQEKRSNVKLAQMMYAENGYTTVQEGATGFEDLKFFQLAAEDSLFFLDIVSFPAWLEMGPVLADPETYPITRGDNYHNHFRIGGIKLLIDGSPQGRTAFMTKDYLLGGPSGEKPWQGEPTMSEEEYFEFIKILVDKKIHFLNHCNGDAAIEMVIKAHEEFNITAEDDMRTVVIHSQFMRPDMWESYKKYGLTPSFFTNHVFFWGDVHIENQGIERASYISPMMDAKNNGIVFSNHTDFSVTPLDPFMTIWTAVTRETRSGMILGPEQRVSPYLALQALTTGPAYQYYEENSKGKLVKGYKADFVILDKNPLKMATANLREITVLETVKEGNSVYAK